MKCPICREDNLSFYFKDKQRDYYRCNRCQLVFANPDTWPSKNVEKGIYDLHVNSPDDLDYRRFLSRLFNPLEKRVPFRAHGLDFGSGPGPTLSVMFEEAGFSMDIYDKYYADNPAVFDKQFDFITATEVIEHLHQPQFEIERLLKLLKTGGILGIMTKLVRDRDAFSNWHYKNDQSHVCFYSVETFEWIAKKYILELEVIGSDVILLTN